MPTPRTWHPAPGTSPQAHPPLLLRATETNFVPLFSPYVREPATLTAPDQSFIYNLYHDSLLESLVRSSRVCFGERGAPPFILSCRVDKLGTSRATWRCRVGGIDNQESSSSCPLPSPPLLLLLLPNSPIHYAAQNKLVLL